MAEAQHRACGPFAPVCGLTYNPVSMLMEMVEAAGVEPASEKVYREKTTCVSGSVVFVRAIRYRQERHGLVRLVSGLGSEHKLLPYPAK